MKRIAISVALLSIPLAAGAQVWNPAHRKPALPVEVGCRRTNAARAIT